MRRIISYSWLVIVIRLTTLLPDFWFINRLRGILVKPCFKKCGHNLQIASNVAITFPNLIELGDDVYIAYGCWMQGVGGVVLGNGVMLGPYTVIATNNHTKENGSYRFGAANRSKIVIDAGAWTGAHVVITAGVHIGKGAACGAGAVVTRDVASDTVVGGVPAKEIGQKPS